MDREPYLFSDAVLKRDATNTEYIVLPLAAAVIAHLVRVQAASFQISDAPDQKWAKWAARAGAILASCSDESDETWRTDSKPYGVVRDFVLQAWPTLLAWTSLTFALFKLEHEPALGGPPHLAAALKWLRTHRSAPLIDSMLVAALAVDDTDAKDDECPLLARSGRPVRVELGIRLRTPELGSWPRIMRAVVSEWTPDNIGRLAFDMAVAAGMANYTLHHLSDELDALEAEIQRRKVTLETGASEQRSKAPNASVKSTDHDTALARNRTQEQQLQTLRQKFDSGTHRDAKQRSRIEKLEQELATAQQRIRELEAVCHTLRTERQPIGSDEAGPPSPVVADDVIPNDVFGGRRILLFTNEQAGDARQAMEESFYRYGATDVRSYWVEKERGPDRVPQDTIVVLDKRFMSHSSSDLVSAMAKKSGAWYCITDRGAALIAKEAAERFVAEHP